MNNKTIFVNLKSLKSMTSAFMVQLSKKTKEVKETYTADILKYKEELLRKIAIDYSLNLEELQQRYMKKKKFTHNNTVSDMNESDTDSDLDTVQIIKNKNIILLKHTCNDIDYYIELINGGNVYNNKNEIIGKWMNNVMHLHNTIVATNIIMNNAEINIENIETPENIIVPTVDILPIENVNTTKVIKRRNKKEGKN